MKLKLSSDRFDGACNTSNFDSNENEVSPRPKNNVHTQFEIWNFSTLVRELYGFCFCAIAAVNCWVSFKEKLWIRKTFSTLSCGITSDIVRVDAQVFNLIWFMNDLPLCTISGSPHTRWRGIKVLAACSCKKVADICQFKVARWLLSIMSWRALCGARGSVCSLPNEFQFLCRSRIIKLSNSRFSSLT